MADATPDPEPFSGPGERLRREARKVQLRVDEAFARLRTNRALTPEGRENILAEIQALAAQITNLYSHASDEEMAASRMASQKTAEAMHRSSEALVKWTRIMVGAIIVQAAAALIQVGVAIAQLLAASRGGSFPGHR